MVSVDISASGRRRSHFFSSKDVVVANTTFHWPMLFPSLRVCGGGVGGVSCGVSNSGSPVVSVAGPVPLSPPGVGESAGGRQLTRCSGCSGGSGGHHAAAVLRSIVVRLFASRSAQGFPS